MGSSSEETSDGDSIIDGFSEDSSSERRPPADFIVDPMWCGEETEANLAKKCSCNEAAHRYVCMEGTALGRKFLGCKKPHGQGRCRGRCVFQTLLKKMAELHVQSEKMAELRTHCHAMEYLDTEDEAEKEELKQEMKHRTYMFIALLVCAMSRKQ